MKVLFFASLREKLQCAEETLTQTDSISTVQDLLDQLISRGEPWLSALQNSRVLVAVNQEMVPLNTAIHADDEVAFFPPVTGG